MWAGELGERGIMEKSAEKVEREKSSRGNASQLVVGASCAGGAAPNHGRRAGQTVAVVRSE